MQNNYIENKDSLVKVYLPLPLRSFANTFYAPIQQQCIFKQFAKAVFAGEEQIKLAVVGSSMRSLSLSLSLFLFVQIK